MLRVRVYVGTRVTSVEISKLPPTPELLSALPNEVAALAALGFLVFTLDVVFAPVNETVPPPIFCDEEPDNEFCASFKSTCEPPAVFFKEPDNDICCLLNATDEPPAVLTDEPVNEFCASFKLTDEPSLTEEPPDKACSSFKSADTPFDKSPELFIVPPPESEDGLPVEAE